ncbi:MAG: prepilin-type N-terminal cleavage/methylation domain-containing protein [Planctomycetota bacterium]
MNPSLSTLPTPPRRARPPARRAGFTLVEVMVAIMVLTVATYILSSTVTAAVSHSIVKSQRTLAAEAAMNAIEQIRAMPQEDVFALFNDVTSDDPYGPGTGPGPTFDVPGLDPVLAGGVPLPIGQVLLPGQNGVLNEALSQPEFGLPRDLDGNLFVEAGNCASSYIVLPLVVRVEWQSKLGPRNFELATMLADMPRWSAQ